MLDKIDNMSNMTLIICIIVMIIFLILFYKWIYKYKRTEKNTTPDDLLYDLSFKVNYSIVCENNELYLINVIKILKHDPLTDKSKLKLIEDTFIRRFSELHLIDEFSAEHLDHTYNEAKVRYNQTLRDIRR